MLKFALIGLLAAATGAAQTPSPSPSPSPAAKSSSTAKKSSAMSKTKSAAPAAQAQASPAGKSSESSKETKKETGVSESAVPPATTVITIHGVCEPHKSALAAEPVASPASAQCTTTISREQFDKVMSLVMPAGRPEQPGMRRTLAQRYVELLAIAEAAEKAGVEKSPEFELLRLRALTEAYQRSLDEKYRNPPQADLDAYYKAHKDDFQSVTLRRIYIPKGDPGKPSAPQDEKSAFGKKAAEVADNIRERAAKGEDLDALQKDAYSKLGLTVTPPSTQVGPVRKGALPPAVDKEIFALSPGGIYKTDEPTAFIIYKAESKQTLPVESVKDEISRTLLRQKMEGTLKNITESVKADYNDTYFGPGTPMPHLPPDKVPPPTPPGAKK